MFRQTQAPSDALAHLAAQADTLPEPYLVTGPQAAYLYHHWLSAMTKIINIRIYSDYIRLKEDVPTWQSILSSPWLVFSQAPTLTQVHRATRVAILEPYLTETLWSRRVIHQGLAFISPEDLCLHFLRTATTQTRLSELSALLIKQKEKLDWQYLFDQAGRTWLLDRLMTVMQTINNEADRTLFALDMPVLVTKRHNYVDLKPTSLIPILRPLRAQWRLAHV